MDLKKDSTREPKEYYRTLQRVFATDTFGSPAEKRNDFLLFSGSREQDVGLGVANELLLFTLRVTRIIRSQALAYLQYVNGTQPIDMADGTFGGIHVRRNIDDRVDYGRKLDTGVLERAPLSVKN